MKWSDYTVIIMIVAILLVAIVIGVAVATVSLTKPKPSTKPLPVNRQSPRTKVQAVQSPVSVIPISQINTPVVQYQTVSTEPVTPVAPVPSVTPVVPATPPVIPATPKPCNCSNKTVITQKVFTPSMNVVTNNIDLHSESTLDSQSTLSMERGIDGYSDDSTCSTPCARRTVAGKIDEYHCRFRDARGITVMPEVPPEPAKEVKGSPVLDVANYSEYTLYLMEDGTITREKGETKKRITNNVKLSQIASFDRYLYGISQGSLYMLDNSTIDSKAGRWNWVKQDWAPITCVYLSNTYDDTHLWIGTVEGGFLFDAAKNRVQQSKNSHARRYYGKDAKTYLEVDTRTNSGVMQPSGRTVLDVKGGGLSYDGKLVPIRAEEKDVSHMRLIKWKPYIVRK